jgi:hypothetical protein
LPRTSAAWERARQRTAGQNGTLAHRRRWPRARWP